MLDEARRDADVLQAERARGRASRTPQAEQERAEREIDAEKDAMLKEVYEQAVSSPR